jgi:hypothetical protein
MTGDLALRGGGGGAEGGAYGGQWYQEARALAGELGMRPLAYSRGRADAELAALG